MSVTGLCEVCEQAQAVDQCRNCGAMVCRTHYQEDMGICVECAVDTDPSWGGPTQQF